MKRTTHAKPAAEGLCLTCGLCCNGVLFADVKVQPADSAERLQALGLRLTARSGAEKQSKGQDLRFTQPCAALEGCRCRIYEERPAHCRQFDCLLLRRVQTGQTSTAAALRVIRTARQRADRVLRLLRESGDPDEQVALAARFRRIARGMEGRALDEQTADLFGQLTLAVHDLNLLLSGAFYPGEVK